MASIAQFFSYSFAITSEKGGSRYFGGRLLRSRWRLFVEILFIVLFSSLQEGILEIFWMRGAFPLQALFRYGCALFVADIAEEVVSVSCSCRGSGRLRVSRKATKASSSAGLSEEP